MQKHNVCLKEIEVGMVIPCWRRNQFVGVFTKMLNILSCRKWNWITQTECISLHHSEVKASTFGQDLF